MPCPYRKCFSSLESGGGMSDAKDITSRLGSSRTCADVSTTFVIGARSVGFAGSTSSPTSSPNLSGT